jgi:hypothetical protein
MGHGKCKDNVFPFSFWEVFISTACCLYVFTKFVHIEELHAHFTTVCYNLLYRDMSCLSRSLLVMWCQTIHKC